MAIAMGMLNVIVAEDEVIIRKDLVISLQRLGCNVLLETSFAEEVLEFIENRTADLIFLDIRLKGDADGLEAARVIGSKTDIPVVIMSAYDFGAQRSEGELENVKEYLSKPIPGGKLKQLIESFQLNHFS
jgi:CheY-like chemotaxis protein